MGTALLVRRCGYALAITTALAHLPELLRITQKGGRRSISTLATILAVLAASRSLRQRYEDAVDRQRALPPVAALAALVYGRVRPASSFGAAMQRCVVALFAPRVLLSAASDIGGADMIAVTGMVLATALEQPPVALALLLMLTGGEALEEVAVDKAGEAVRALLQRCRAPQRVRRRKAEEEELVEVDAVRKAEEEELVEADAVVAGDTLLLDVATPDCTVPVDCTLLSAAPVYVDESALTGEPGKRLAKMGAGLLSGSVLSAATADARAPIVCRAERPLAASAMTRMVEALTTALEETSGGCGTGASDTERTGAFLGQLFEPVALAAAALSFLRLRALGTLSARERWLQTLSLLSGATECPLKIGVPVAFLCAVSVASRAGITVKSRRALEALGSVTALILDKTGTLTRGTPSVAAAQLEPAESAEEVLALVHALEARSRHIVAEALVRHAREALPAALQRHAASDVEETPGKGIRGAVTTAARVVWPKGAKRGVGQPGRRHAVMVGSAALLAESGVAVPRDAPAADDDCIVAHVAVDGVWRGRLLLRDELQPDFASNIGRLRARARLAVASGDPNIGQWAARHGGGAELFALGTTHALPGEKAALVRTLVARGERVAMLGDGTNDAAALATAHVGVSVGTDALASESADIVLARTTEPLRQLNALMQLATRTRRVARGGAAVGMTISLMQMGLAHAGVLTAFQNACVQEGVDLGVTLNALRLVWHDMQRGAAVEN
jgi:cation transport ATPase